MACPASFFRGVVIPAATVSLFCIYHVPAEELVSQPPLFTKNFHHKCCHTQTIQKVPQRLSKKLYQPRSKIILNTTAEPGGEQKVQQRKLKQLDDEDYPLEERPKPDSSGVPLLAFRIIGCSCVSIFVGVTIIIYVTSSMFYQDCIAQICSEGCLLSAYTCLLLITTESQQMDQGFCLGVAIFLHFSFLACFLFMLLEVVSMARMLFEIFPRNSLFITRNMLLFGWGVPIAVTGLSAILLYDEYTSKTNCWLDLNKSPFWPTVLPIGIFVGIQTILLLFILTISEVPYISSYDSDYDRAKSFLTTRWASLIILIATVSSWSCGILASHSNGEALYAAFAVLSIILGVVIFILRISTDYEVRKLILSIVLSLILHPRNKVTVWSEKAMKTSNGLPGEKKIAVVSRRASGNEQNTTNPR